MSADGFLSFANKDWHDIAPLCAGLAARGIELWIVTERREPSTRWHDAVRGGIEIAAAVILVVSPAWVHSPPCAYELGLARGMRRPIISLVELSQAMTVSDLPSVLRAPDVEHVDARHSIAHAAEEIASRLRPAAPD
ncbi:MAG: hypothetical protein QOI48_502 [Solirubrobacteraceae bacterium]|jgi:hypothetical protein|nr:hypothetical protein [Solirubrobacteraceae bacterium]